MWVLLLLTSTQVFKSNFYFNWYITRNQKLFVLDSLQCTVSDILDGKRVQVTMSFCNNWCRKHHFLDIIPQEKVHRHENRRSYWPLLDLTYSNPPSMEFFVKTVSLRYDGKQLLWAGTPFCCNHILWRIVFSEIVFSKSFGNSFCRNHK